MHAPAAPGPVHCLPLPQAAAPGASAAVVRSTSCAGCAFQGQLEFGSAGSITERNSEQLKGRAIYSAQHT